MRWCRDSRCGKIDYARNIRGIPHTGLWWMRPIRGFACSYDTISLVHGLGQFLGWMSFEDTWIEKGRGRGKSVDGKSEWSCRPRCRRSEISHSPPPHRLIVAIYKLIGGGKGNWFAKRTCNKSILIGATNTVYTLETKRFHGKWFFNVRLYIYILAPIYAKSIFIHSTKSRSFPSIDRSSFADTPISKIIPDSIKNGKINAIDTHLPFLILNPWYVTYGYST